MVKIFNEEDRITVVFPKVDGASEVIERILKEVYGEAEDVHEEEVKGLIASRTPLKANGVKVISKEPKKTYVRTNAILKDSRNPYNMVPYEAFKKHGITAMLSYSKMGLSASEYDVQISREIFIDFKKYLKEINNENYMTETDIEEIKNIISVISTKIYAEPMKSILKSLACDSINTFFTTASEAQIRSAAVKIVNDTINYIK